LKGPEALISNIGMQLVRKSELPPKNGSPNLVLKKNQLGFPLGGASHSGRAKNSSMDQSEKRVLQIYTASSSSSYRKNMLEVYLIF
jgi:hypothetical protein